MRLASLKINLFGEFRVWRGEDLIKSEEWGRQKTRSLLKLLVTRPGRVFPRDEILEALWPGASPKAADHSLRTTVGLLRRVLEPDLERGLNSRYILSKRPGYAFNHRADYWVDAWEFEQHRKTAEAAWEGGKLDETIEECRAALDLVEEEFLVEDPYEEWAVEARQEWRESQLSVLSLLAECLAQKGRYTEAIEACEDALTLERYSEDLHRRLMLYRYCSGEQGLALNVYRDYAKALEEQLNAVPSPELTRLKEQIETRNVPGVDEKRRYPKPRRPLRFPYSLGRTRFVGRDRQYALLAERLREAMDDEGVAVAVDGEAGVGKTRLVEEFLGHARSRNVRVVAGRCYERELGPPLEPVMEALKPLPHVGRMILELSGSELYPRPGAGSHNTSRMYQALTDELIRESQSEDHEGIVFFLDDVQWADPATLDFLTYLARRISGDRVLLLLTYRREDIPELSGWLDQLTERRALSVLRLSRLSLEDIVELLGSISSRSFGELSSLADFLQQESEGNPFYAVEYLRWLLESDIVAVDSRRRISHLNREALRQSVMPSGVRSLIQARLHSLGNQAQNLLELAAVIGRAFDLGLLSDAGALEEAVAYDTIEPLVNSGLIVENAEGDAYYFTHDKLRQTLYEGIGGYRRRRLHLRVAQALKTAGGEPAELAHHYLRAQEWRPALENLVSAAQRAEKSYAWETALASYDRALEITDQLPRSDEQHFRLLEARERLLEHLDRSEERAVTVQEMLEVASRLGDRTRIAEVHIRRIGVLAALTDSAAATDAGREAASIFCELGDEAGEARVYREMAYVCWANRDYASALEANFRALRIHREIGNRRGEAGDVGNIAEVYRGMGDDEQPLRWADEAVRIYRELGDKLSEAMRLATVAIHRERGEPETALRLVLKTLLLYSELGVKNLLVAQHSACGTLYLGLGAPEKALEHFRTAARLGREIGYTRDEGYALMSVGAALEQLGDHSGAAEAYRRASELLDKAYRESGMLGELSGKADALALLAKLLHRSLERAEEALITYRVAADIYRELDDPERLRKLLLGMAGLCWRTERLEESARGYEEVLELARTRGERSHEAVALASLSVVYRDLDLLRESLRRGREASVLLRRLGDLQAEAYVLKSLADSYGRCGHYSSALSCLRRSLRLRRRIGDEEGEIVVIYELAKVYNSLGNMEAASASFEEAAQKERELEASQIGIGAERRN